MKPLLACWNVYVIEILCFISITWSANNDRDKNNRTHAKNHIMNDRDYNHLESTTPYGLNPPHEHSKLHPLLIEHPVIVNTKMGDIKGKVISKGGVLTSQFLGIPYALPPVRERRFLPPRKHFGWGLDEAWDATGYRSLCYHNTTVEKDPDKQEEHNHNDNHDNVSEDCLYLNLYIPRNISAVEHLNTLRLPIMVYIHGGDFSHYHHGNKMHDGQQLAIHGNVIVATLDYRQGILGFLSLLDPAAPGNLGLLDQKLALHWIWDNIQEFGGNPMSITVFGQGFGAVSIGYHILSPISKGLFNRAILQSGTMLSPDMIQKDPVDNALAVAIALGCGHHANYTDKIACLQKEPVAHLQHTTTTISWLPVIDSLFLTDEPHKLLSRGEHNKVTIVLGVENNHAEIIAMQKGYSAKDGISKGDLETEMRTTLGPLFTTRIEQVVSLTLTQYDFCEQSSQDRYQTLLDFLMDYNYLYPIYESAKLLSRGDRPVYFYEFAHRLRDGEVVQPKENHFVFGYVAEGDGGEEVRRLEEELSEVIMEAWSNFASQGDPNPVNLKFGTYWFPFNDTHEQYLQFRAGMDHTAARTYPHRRRMAFWEFLYTLRVDEKQTTCQAGRDVCAHRVRSVAEEKQQTTLVLWITAGVCGGLFLLVIILFLKLLLPADMWPSCCCRDPQRRSHKVNGTDQEHRFLRPLPYYDES